MASDVAQATAEHARKFRLNARRERRLLRRLVDFFHDGHDLDLDRRVEA